MGGPHRQTGFKFKKEKGRDKASHGTFTLKVEKPLKDSDKDYSVKLTQPDKTVLVFPTDASNITELKKKSLLKGTPKTLPQIFNLPR